MGTQRDFEACGPAGPHKISYMDWGHIHNPNILFCVHGLTRNSRDFDTISNVLSEEYRIICMDVAGRGKSDWLNQSSDYAYPQYIVDTIALLEHLQIDQVDWLGTSMGGILGMLLAASPNTPIKKLIINDIGPFIPSGALKRIAQYLGKAPEFPSINALEQYLRRVHAPFGPLTDQQWLYLASHSAQQDTSGNWSLNYDPAISITFGEALNQDIDLWEVWEKITCPTLMLRGENSDILPAEVALRAQSCGPKTTLQQFKDIGHAPALMSDDQIICIQRWLAR